MASREPRAVMRRFAWFAGLLCVLAGAGGCASAAGPASSMGPPPAPSAVTPPEPSPPAAAHEPAPDTTPPTTAPPTMPESDSLAPPLPEGFVWTSPEVGLETVEARCGALTIQHVNPDPNAYEPFVRVLDASGKVVYQAHGRRYRVSDDPADPEVRMSLVADVCGDLTGDGVPELILTERTMGAHCCYTHYVVSLTKPATRLLMWEKGDSGNGMWPVKATPGPRFQVMSMDLIDPPFDAEAGDPVIGGYAGIPSYPIIFDLVGNEYRKRTFAFPDFLRTRRAEHRAECEKAPDDCGWNELAEWGYALILGDWDAEKLTAVPDAELRAALDRRAAEMRSILRRRLGY